MAIIDKPSDYFNTVLYTGNGASSRAISVGFQSDWVWNKPRTNTNDYQLVDSVRGGGKVISSNLSDAEYTAGNTILSFGSDGFTCGDGASVNANGVTYASWNWKAGTSVSGNTTGSGTAKTYTGSVNTTSGFSIIKYTGNGTAGHTIPHNLDSAPKTTIVKALQNAQDWQFISEGLGADKFLQFNQTGAELSQGTHNMFNSTRPSNTVVTLGNQTHTNANNQTHIAYCFAEKQGYSKFGSYTGNGNANGPFIYLGFSPSFVLYKVSSAASDWYIQDNKRLTYNVNNTRLEANNSDTEVTGAADSIDMLSNGFKLRHTSSSFNASGATYIFMAFAENPFTTSTGVPATAR